MPRRLRVWPNLRALEFVSTCWRRARVDIAPPMSNGCLGLRLRRSEIVRSRLVRRRDRFGLRGCWHLLAALVLLGASGCASSSTRNLHEGGILTGEPAAQLLSVGDVIRVSFPGAPNLDAPPQQIRRDGRINLAMVGEVMAAEKTPADLEKELGVLYAPQLVSKEIKVTVVSSTFAVLVNGAVLRPGKITADRVLTALEAVMEAGGFDSGRADPKAVVVIRMDAAGRTQNHTIDLKAVLEGKSSEPFYLRANDIVYVPEKFSWF